MLSIVPSLSVSIRAQNVSHQPIIRQNNNGWYLPKTLALIDADETTGMPDGLFVSNTPDDVSVGVEVLFAEAVV